MNDIAAKIKFQTQHYPGYGGPPSWSLRVTYENILLDEESFSSEFGLGEGMARLKRKWRKAWTSSTFQRAIKGKLAASRLCDHCGGNTIDGASSCLNKIFCKKCQKFIPEYQERYRLECGESERIRVAEAEEAESERLAEMARQLSGAFHWRDDWYFRRMDDGSVRMMHRKRGGYEYLDVDMIVPSNEWASIVCSVSSDGETGERWNVAQDFHGRQHSLANAA